MKFEFKFKSLLNIRRYEEKLEQQKLGGLLQERLHLEKCSMDAERELLGYEQGLKAGGSQRVLEVQRNYECRQDLQKEVWQVKKKLVQLDREIEKQRKNLREANKRTKMLEKIKDRERARFVEEFQHKQQLQQNEIATQMFNRSE